MKIKVNSKELEVPEGLTVEGLIRLRDEEPSTCALAVAIDQKVVRRPDWAKTVIPEGANITLIKAVYGG